MIWLVLSIPFCDITGFFRCNIFFAVVTFYYFNCYSQNKQQLFNDGEDSVPEMEKKPRAESILLKRDEAHDHFMETDVANDNIADA